MEPETTVKPGTPRSFSNVVTVLLAIVVTADVCIFIARRWGTYDWLSKSLAIILVSYLVVVPGSAFWGWKAGRSLGLQQLAMAAYGALLLTTLLFNR